MPSRALVPLLSADRPVQSLTADLLHRGDFAIALANGIVEWRGMDSLVLAVYGEWGSGKSSVKNMMLQLLRQHESRPSIIEFNPWAWSGQDRLLTAFFNEIGTKLDNHAGNAGDKELALKWRRYAARLSFGGSVFGVVKAATQAIGVPVLPLLLEEMEQSTARASGLATSAAKVYEAMGTDEPLEELKQSIAAKLAAARSSLVVVMDDIDRLSKEEIRQLFQVVKANADFPRLIYLMLFDRAVVERALEGHGGGSGREYMEKIVQAGLALPQAQQEDLDRVLVDGMNAVLSFDGADRTFDESRWPNLYLSCIRPFLKTVRDIRRLLSSLSFDCGLLYRKGVLEVNILDLIAIETLRMFEPGVYQRLPSHKEALIGEGSFLGFNDDSKALEGAEEDLLSIAARRDTVKSLLGDLFPRLRGFGSDGAAEWRRTLRVCAPDHFDRYFVAGVPIGDVPQSLIDEIIDAARSRSRLRGLFKSLKKSGQLKSVLDRLEAHRGDLDLTHAESFVTAVLDMGDDLDCEFRGLTSVPEVRVAAHLIRFFLLREPSLELRSKLLLAAVRKTTGLYLPVDIVNMESSDRTRTGYRDKLLLGDKELPIAQRLCVRRIASFAARGRLPSNLLGYYCWRWREWAGDAPVRQYVKKMVRTRKGALQFIRGFLVRIQSATALGTPLGVRYEIRLSDIEPLADVEHLNRMLVPLLRPIVPRKLAALARDFSEELATWRMAMRRRAEGKPEQSLFDDDQ